MPHLAGVICENCAARLAHLDRGELSVTPTARVVVPPIRPGDQTTIVLICRCGSRRPWSVLPGYEVKSPAPR